MIAEKLYSPNQVAQLLGTSAAEVDGWIRQGRLQSLHLPGGRTGVGELALVQFLKTQGIDLRELMAQILVEKAKAPPPEPDDDLAEPAFAEPAFAAPPPVADPPEAPAPAAPSAAPPPPRKTPPQNPAATSASTAALAAAGPVVEATLRDALQRGATAIHFESQPDGLALRLRIGGRLYEKPNFRRRFPPAMASSLLAGFKRLAGLDLGSLNRPQKGDLKLFLEGRTLDVRVSTCPTQHGQNLVIVLRPASADPVPLDQLGLASEDLAAIRQVLAEPAGLILVTAPPGVSTTRTLLALAAAAAAPHRSTAVLSDGGFGAALPGAIHVSRAQAAGLGDAAVIRALQRQDADVIVIDEIRDGPALIAAVEAAQAGSQVLAASADHSLAPDPTMLTAAGADPLAVSQALRAMIVQRTLRLLCSSCKAPAPVDADLLHRMNLDPDTAPPTWIGCGCDLCRHTGFSGEVEALAVTIIDPRVARRISMRSDAPSIEEAARHRSVRTLPEAVLSRVWEGAASLEEAARVLGW
jgi:general secretion pathway protein E